MLLQRVPKIRSASVRTKKDINMVLVIASLFVIFGAFLTMGNIQVGGGGGGGIRPLITRQAYN